MSTKTIREQIQQGIDARLAVEHEPRHDAEADRIKAAAGVRMLGFDGASVEEAARQAHVAGGPSVEELAEMIRVRRQHPSMPGKVAA